MIATHARLHCLLAPSRRALLLGGALAVIVSAMWLWGFNTHSFTRRDAYDYAQLSVAFRRSGNLDTLQVFPRHLPFLHQKGYLSAGAWPNLYRSPLLTLTNALFQPFFESPVVSLVFQSGFWYLACLVLLFFLASALANLRVALLAALFYAADPSNLLYSYSGMSEPLASFLFLALCTALFLAPEKPWKWLLAGLLAGLAYLARAQFAVLFPLLAVFVWFAAERPARLSSLLLLLVGALIPLAPWMARNLRVAGEPFFSFTNTRNLVLDSLPGPSDLEMQLRAPVDLAGIFRRYGIAIASKFLRNASANAFSPAYWANSFRGLPVLLLPFFLVALFEREPAGRRALARARWAAFACLLATFLLVSLTVYSVRSYLAFRPLILLIALAEIDRLLRRWPARRALSLALLGLLGLYAAYQLGAGISDHRNAPRPESFFDQKTQSILQRKVNPEALVASDVSEQVSLQLGVRSLRLPSDPAELLEIDRRYLRVDFVMISKGTWSGSSASEEEASYHETYRDYVAFLSSPAFLQAFTFEERLPNGSLFYRRRGEGH